MGGVVGKGGWDTGEWGLALPNVRLSGSRSLSLVSLLVCHSHILPLYFSVCASPSVCPSASTLSLNDVSVPVCLLVADKSTAPFLRHHKTRRDLPQRMRDTYLSVEASAGRRGIE